MSFSPPTGAPAAAAFVCDCDTRVSSACEGLPLFKEHEGKRYCVLHYPGKDKAGAFNKTLKGKLDVEDFDFRGVWFPDEVNFVGFIFTKFVDFTSATFSAEVDFRFARF